MTPPVLHTPRLLLRRWTDDDLPAFAEMSADPRVMEYFPKLLNRQESDLRATRMRERMDQLGYGFWALEILGGAKFIGFAGLTTPNFESHFTPCVEIGWRLVFAHWGHGYATEAARASLEFGFNEVNPDQIVAFTVPANLRSRRVMDRLGMTYDAADDFDHPNIPEGNPCRRHVLYRLSRDAWRRTRPE